MDKYDRTLQLQHVVFANQCLQNIQEQGFLKETIIQSQINIRIMCSTVIEIHGGPTPTDG
mgnify:CR=1 FL=1